MCEREREREGRGAQKKKVLECKSFSDQGRSYMDKIEHTHRKSKGWKCRSHPGWYWLCLRGNEAKGGVGEKKGGLI